jgi:hypothetical protein
MKICNTFVLMGLVFNVGTASAGMSPTRIAPTTSDIHQIPTVDANRAIFDNDCANFAAAMDANLTDPIVAEWKKQCSLHPDMKTCLETVKYVREAKNGDNAGLVCKGAHASLDSASTVSLASR